MKKVVGFLLGLLFVVIVVAIVVVCTYTLSQPSREGETRVLINGVWYTQLDENGEGYVFDISSSGDFVMHKYTEAGKYDDYDEDDIITKGYLRVDEDSKLIKLLSLPKYKNEDFGFDYTLYFFTNFSYTELDYVNIKKNSDEYQDYFDPTCKFIIGDKIFEVTQMPNDKDIYGS